MRSHLARRESSDSTSRGRNEEEQAAWRAETSQLPAEAFVFIDECGSNIALTPLYARAPKWERASGSVPRNRQEYDVDRGSLPFWHGSSDDPGRIGQHDGL